VGVCIYGFCNVWVCVFMGFVMCGCFDNCVGVLVIRRGSAAVATWDYWFESRRCHGFLSLVNVMCFQVEVSASADHSSRGVLPSVVCLSVTGKPRQ
jgi:hypothetical protein